MRFCKFNAVSVPPTNKNEKPKFTTKKVETKLENTKKPRVKKEESKE